jgi:ABC-2 type transport system ATP-binding protein
MQQKVQLGVTMMHDPKLLILDEPTKGFDPVNRRLLMDMVEERVKAGATVVLVTHQMEEVERLCDRVMLLKDGKRRLYGPVDQVRREFGSDEIILQYSGELPVSKLYTAQSINSHSSRIIPADSVAPQKVLRELSGKSGLVIESFVVQQPSLDDIFVQIYQEKD